jgi:hypothetical protein
MSALPINPFATFPRQSYVVLGPARTPGVAKCRGANSPRNWDVQQGWGFSGAVVYFHGTGLAKFEVDVFLWKPEQFLEWKLFANVLRPPPPGSKGPTALGISHPAVNMPPLNITEVVVEDCTQFEQGPTGLWSCTIKLLQYRKPLPAVARPIAAIPAAPATVQDPPDPNEKIIAELMLAQAKKGGVL